MKSEWATNVAIVVVLAIWSTSLIVDMVDPHYDPPPGLEPLIMALAGFLFATRQATHKSNPDDRTDDEGDK